MIAKASGKTRRSAVSPSSQAACDKSQQNGTLSLQQEHALAGLLSGLSVTDTAKAAGVNRGTVHRWLKEDFTFQAAVHQGQHELRNALQTRLSNLAENAVSCVEKAIQEGDAKTAMALLRGLGLLKGKALPIPSDDPVELEEDILEEKYRRDRRSLRKSAMTPV